MEAVNHPVSVWIIDDDPLYTLIMESALKKLDFIKEMHAFNAAPAALDTLRLHAGTPAQLPDVLLLDINMPVMDGWEFLAEYQALKDHLAKPPAVYMVSSSIDAADRNRARTYPDVLEYIVKPLTTAKLREVAARF